MMGPRFILRALLAGGGGSGLVPTGSRINVFQEIYTVFLALGTAVGVVVMGYALYNAYKYRDGDGDGVDADVDRPTVGELPQGGGGGRKLFLSFFASTVIVLSLILWTYGALQYVEASSPVDQQEDALTVEVTGYQFGWEFEYPNGATANALRVPVNEPVRLVVTSRDVFHNFGISALRVKADAIPGQTTETWFVGEEVANHTARCYELCGAGHSYMTADVVVMPQDEYQRWYATTNSTEGS